MTQQQKRQIAIGVITALIGALFLGAASFTREQVIFRPEYALNLQRDSAWKAEQRAMTLDVLCAPNVDPTNRRCR